MKIFNSLVWVNPLLNQEMNFPMAAHTKSAKVGNHIIGFVCINMMDIKSFFIFRTYFTFFRKISIANRDITPTFIPRTIAMMALSFKGKLALFGAKLRRFLSINSRLILDLADKARFSNSIFSGALSRAKSRSMEAISIGMKIFPTFFANLNNFRTFSHTEGLYGH